MTSLIIRYVHLVWVVRDPRYKTLINAMILSGVDVTDTQNTLRTLAMISQSYEQTFLQ